MLALWGSKHVGVGYGLVKGAQFLASEDMEMEVLNGLAGVLTAVGNHTVAIGEAQNRGQIADYGEKTEVKPTFSHRVTPIYFKEEISMRTNMKKALAVLLTLVMLCGLLPMGMLSVSAADPVVSFNLDFNDGTTGGFSGGSIMTGGGPGSATYTLVYYVYKCGFTYYRMGYGSAVAVVLFILLLIITLIQWNHNEKK